MPENTEPHKRHDRDDIADPGLTWSIGPERIAHVISNQAPGLGTTRLVTIDGPAGAGKTTYAKQLADAMRGSGFTTATIQMDDLYNGWDGLSDPQLPSHLQDWILRPLQSGQAIQHPVFDWERKEFGGKRQLPTADNLIVEGVGAGQPALAEYADFRLWLSAPVSVRAARLRARQGPSPDEWWQRWRSQEDEYFARHNPAALADWIIDTAPSAL